MARKSKRIMGQIAGGKLRNLLVRPQGLDAGNPDFAGIAQAVHRGLGAVYLFLNNLGALAVGGESDGMSVSS